MEQKQMEKKMKMYLKAAKKSAKGSKRAKKKLRSMAENDLITVIAKKATNHPAWYTHLGSELIGLNYGGIDLLGNREDLAKDQTGSAIRLRTTVDALIPVILTVPSDETLRVAAQKIVNELRLVSGANTIYDVDDMIDYLLNIRSIWVALTQIRRAVRSLNACDPYDQDAWRKYLQMSLYYVETTAGITPSGFDQEFRKSAAGIVNWLNTIVKAVRFMMPLNLSVFERTKWMFENVFVDGTGKKFGTKMFVTPAVPYYVHAAGSTVHTASMLTIMGPQETVNGMISHVEQMVNDFTTKVANVAIAGDLMKAYGMASFYNPGQINYDEKLPFIYDERALEQIANADIVGDKTYNMLNLQYDGVNPTIVMTPPSGTSSTLSKAQFAARTGSWTVKFVNTDDNSVEGGETLSLTRLKATVEAEVSDNKVTAIKVIDSGTEVVRDYLYITGYTSNGLLQTANMQDVETAPGVDLSLRYISSWTMDDYGPMIPLYSTTATPGSGSVWAAHPMWDFKNWALMSRTEQHQLHRTAVLSLFMPTASVIQQATSVLS